MPVFAQLQRASFGGLAFPVESVDIQGSIRDHIHIYPHAPGGAPEKMGRNLYTIRMQAIFSTTFKTYPNLWPTILGLLRRLYEDQTSTSLVIPTIGTIPAYCRSWTQQMTNKISSGERATFEFVEDQGTAGLTAALVSVNVSSLARAASQFDAIKALNDFANDQKASGLLDSITDAVNGVLSVGDQIELQGNLIGAKLLALSNLLEQADHLLSFDQLQNAKLISAMHDLWDTANTARDNLQKKSFSPLVYIVPTTMAMSAISTALYGDSTHTVDLMQLNAVEDVFAVPAGTQISYYPLS